ncbi:MAG: glycine--tRNA ligase [Candidatus Shikimatogenerans bostrichidophilus]|nr:MAG: glycine--tRNA ligase [Candidatus Shikimatogenerans bostrichidophilus]
MKKKIKNINYIINFARNYGFIYKSSEIYNGIKGIYDYGPNGLELKNNIKKYWWEFMVKYRENIIGIETSILMNNKVWVASGHKKHFYDYYVILKNKQYKFNDFINLINKKLKNKKKKKISKINNKKKLNNLINKYVFLKKYKIKKIVKINLMFKININNFKKKKIYTFLRPETAQGIFINYNNFKNKLNIPFGIAQIGKSFRNEIITKQFIFRTKEFEQMEMQFFVCPGEEKKWYKFWIKNRLKWHLNLNLGYKYYRKKKHKKLSHYSIYATDIEFKYINKFKEIEGIHFRKNYDLTNHQKMSKKKMTYYDIKKKKKYIPYVIETSLGLDRTFYSILSNSIIIEKKNNIKRIYLNLPFFLSPNKIAILPLIKNNINIIKFSKKIFNYLKYKYDTIYDDKKSIGKRYRIQDAIGTPYCITIDKISLFDKTVTIRNRNTMKQIRLKINMLNKYFKKKINYKIINFYKKNIKNEI